MKTLHLIRQETGDQGTQGIIRDPKDGWSCFAIELPWRDNAVNVSCIPAGQYPCVWYFSPAFKQWMYGVREVEGRSGIAIHSGNVAGNKDKGFRSHSLGCILPGQKRGTLWGQAAVLASRLAAAGLARQVDKKSFILKIKEENE